MTTLPPGYLEKQRQFTEKNEDYCQFPYTDTTGHITIGIGRNLSQSGISYSESVLFFENDVEYFYTKLNNLLSYFGQLNLPRQLVLIDICFNVGVNGLLQFRLMLSALESNDFDRAADEIVNSKAYTQSPNRYQKNSNIMRTGVL